MPTKKEDCQFQSFFDLDFFSEKNISFSLTSRISSKYKKSLKINTADVPRKKSSKYAENM